MDRFIHNSSLPILVPVQRIVFNNLHKILLFSHFDPAAPCWARVGVSRQSWCIIRIISLLIISSARCRSFRGGSEKNRCYSIAQIHSLSDSPACMGLRTAWFISRGLGRSLLTGADLLLIASSCASLAISSDLSSTSPWSSM